MTRFEPRDPDFAARVRSSFERQSFMAHLGIELARIEPGLCELHMPWHADLLQQHGYFHGGAIATVLDSAAGYAAFSLMPPATAVLTAEYKLNFVAPGAGERIIARGEVVRPGRTLTVVRADAYALKDGEETLVCASQQTLMALAGQSDEALGTGGGGR